MGGGRGEGASGLVFNCLLCQGGGGCSGGVLAPRALCSVWGWLEQFIMRGNDLQPHQVCSATSETAQGCTSSWWPCAESLGIAPSLVTHCVCLQRLCTTASSALYSILPYWWHKSCA